MSLDIITLKKINKLLELIVLLQNIWLSFSRTHTKHSLPNKQQLFLVFNHCIHHCNKMMSFFIFFNSNKITSYLLVKTFPVILSHETEQGEKSPAKSIKARVTMVRIFPSLQTYISLRACAAKHKKQSVRCTLNGSNMETLISRETHPVLLVIHGKFLHCAKPQETGDAASQNQRPLQSYFSFERINREIITIALCCNGKQSPSISRILNRLELDA